MKPNYCVMAILGIAIALGGSSGCGTAPATDAQLSSHIDAQQFRLDEEPEGAMGVIEARESAADGAPLVLVGRVGGSTNPWVEGRAAFGLLDASMTVVAEGEGTAEGQICTGDCCDTERVACTTFVKVLDANGQVVPVDSRQLLGIKENDIVVVQGTAKKDQEGNFTMLATRVFVRK